uniref:Uncharacterized protein n=1 Tax=Myotis myotis TaxID=51298 RepID=A0A7J7UPR9_MYOMY|nr:hypothetical protein mMyoMyo1_008549 [Myotis myotis]
MAFSQVPSTQSGRRGCEEEAGPCSWARERGWAEGPRARLPAGLESPGSSIAPGHRAGPRVEEGEAHGLLWVPRVLVREGDRTVPAWQPRHKCPCLARCWEEGGPLAVGAVSGHVPKVRPEAWAHGTTCSGQKAYPWLQTKGPTTSLDGGGRSRTQMLYRCLGIGLSPGGGRSTCLIPENVQPQSLSRDASGAGCATASFPLDRRSGRGSGRGQKAI